MRRASNRFSPRHGFTLVELLVVMTIIAILFALAAAAVVKALTKADETKTRNEISQLQNGVQAFKTDFGVAYIPDTLYFPPSADPTGASSQYITSCWPRIASAALTTGSYWGAPSNQTVKLQGYQTLVFFLGGAADTSGNRIGFSTDPTNPMSTTGQLGAANRKGPYFDSFPPTRLTVLASDQSTGPAPSPFPAFIDVYGTMPYLYFSSAKAGNDYTATAQSGQVVASNPATAFSVSPFLIGGTGTTVRYANANSFQIISAGRDTIFGTGGMNWPGYPGGGTNMNGYDDMANFHPVLLGIPAQ